jgi:phage tail-like protein
MNFSDPLPSYRFLVTLDPADAHLPPQQAALLPLAPIGDFSEVRGLGGDLEVMSYPEGGANGYSHQLPIRHSWSRIILRRGVVSDPGLWWWYQVGLTNSLGARRDGAIILLTPSGQPAVSWCFFGGLAAKWIGPDLSATQNAVAVESLEIAHEGLLQIPFPSPSVP